MTEIREHTGEDGHDMVASTDMLATFLEAAFCEDSRDMVEPLAEVLATALRLPEEDACVLAAELAASILPARPAEYRVRVVKEAQPSIEQRSQFIIEATALIVTSPQSTLGAEEQLNCSLNAIKYVTALLMIDDDMLSPEIARKMAHKLFDARLYGYIRAIVERMSDATDDGELATYLTQATVIADLSSDITEIVAARSA